MNTTTAGAEDLVQGLLDQRDLYATTSRHERRLLDCVKDLWQAVVVKEPEVAWQDFRQWVLNNKTLAVEHANVFLSAYLEANREQKSCSHTVSLYIQAWRSWGINVSTRIVEQIAQFEKEDWRPAQLTRRNEQQTVKLRQFESLDKLWPSMVEYMTDVTGSDFRVQLQSVSSNRGAHKEIAASSFNEMDVLARKSNTNLSGILKSTLGYASMLRTSGMRGLTGINAKLADFTVLEDKSVLLERWEKKLGSTRNVSKPVYIRIAPGTEPSHDPLVHMARHIANSGVTDQQVFGYGFDRKLQQDDEAFAKCPQRRFIAVLHAVAIACGSAGGLGERKLHAFRVMSENRMGQLGISTHERADYIGWASTTQATSYSLMKSRALNSNVPYILAGRDSKDDPPHPMWKLLDDVPDIVVGYWVRVLYLAIAAKAIQDNNMTIAPSFQEQMDDHLRDAKKKKADSANPKLLLKRIRELERDVQLERSKRARLELVKTSTTHTAPANDDDKDEAQNTNTPTSSTAHTFDPVDALTTLVNQLKAKRKEADFPSACGTKYNEISTLINAGSTPMRSFALPLSTATGKDLARILLLVVLNDRCPGVQLDGSSRNWFSWIDANRKDHPLLKRVDMRCWKSYQNEKI